MSLSLLPVSLILSLTHSQRRLSSQSLKHSNTCKHTVMHTHTHTRALSLSTLESRTLPPLQSQGTGLPRPPTQTYEISSVVNHCKDTEIQSTCIHYIFFTYMSELHSLYFETFTNLKLLVSLTLNRRRTCTSPKQKQALENKEPCTIFPHFSRGPLDLQRKKSCTHFLTAVIVSRFLNLLNRWQ